MGFAVFVAGLAVAARNEGERRRAFRPLFPEGLNFVVEVVEGGNRLAPIIEHRRDLRRGSLVAGDFENLANAGWQRAFMEKIGLTSWSEADAELLRGMFEALAEAETDFTLFFRNLSAVPLERPSLEPLRRAFYTDQPRPLLESWLERYSGRLRLEGLSVEERKKSMNGANPKYVPRNYLAQSAIDALENGDASVLERLMDVLKRPYDEQPEHDVLAERRPEWARHRAGCSALSCSS